MNQPLTDEQKLLIRGFIAVLLVELRLSEGDNAISQDMWAFVLRTRIDVSRKGMEELLKDTRTMDDVFVEVMKMLE